MKYNRRQSLAFGGFGADPERLYDRPKDGPVLLTGTLGESIDHKETTTVYRANAFGILLQE